MLSSVCDVDTDHGDTGPEILDKAVNDAWSQQVGNNIELNSIGILNTGQHPAMLLHDECILIYQS